MSKRQLEKKLRGIFEPCRSITFTSDGDGSARITVTSEDEGGIGVNFEMLQKLAAIFGTQKINTDSYQSKGGCETCDYGAEWDVDFVITEATKNKERAGWDWEEQKW